VSVGIFRSQTTTTMVTFELVVISLVTARRLVVVRIFCWIVDCSRRRSLKTAQTKLLNLWSYPERVDLRTEVGPPKRLLSSRLLQARKEFDRQMIER